MSLLAGTVANGLRSIESVKAGGSESDLFSRWAGQQAQVINAGQELGLLSIWLAVLPPALSSSSPVMPIT